MRLIPPLAHLMTAVTGDVLWLPLVRRILGEDCKLLFHGLVVTGLERVGVALRRAHVADDWHRQEPAERTSRPLSMRNTRAIVSRSLSLSST